jgi:exonuclease VII small subunit
MSEVNHGNLFETMMKYHVQNLRQSLPHIQNGQILDKDGTPLEQGENPYYKGLYLIYDGHEILEKASQRIVRGSAIRETTDVPTQHLFFQTLTAKNTQHKKDPDVAYLYNTKDAKLTRVKGELSNHCEEDLDHILQRCLPEDFESPDGSLSIYDIGTKTANAVLTAYALNSPTDQGVRTIIVKKTPYGSLGMGKLAEFGKDGLTREFYFEHNPNHTGPFIDPEHHIVGVYKQYAHPHQKPAIQYISAKQLETQTIDPTQRALHKTSPGIYSATPTSAISMQTTL